MFKKELCGLKDLNSYNGTTVNGKRVSQPVRLYDGDQIRISKFTLIFHARDAAGQQSFAKPETPNYNAAGSTTAVEIGKKSSSLRLPRAMAMAPASESAILLLNDILPKPASTNTDDPDTQSL